MCVGAHGCGAEVVHAVPCSAMQMPTMPRSSFEIPPTPPPFYTTTKNTTNRAKAGGKQSTKDATGKFARSAGSRLRRYNEVALSRDITALIKEWGPLLGAAQAIFVAAPGSNSRCEGVCGGWGSVWCCVVWCVWDGMGVVRSVRVQECIVV